MTIWKSPSPASLAIRDPLRSPASTAAQLIGASCDAPPIPSLTVAAATKASCLLWWWRRPSSQRRRLLHFLHPRCLPSTHRWSPRRRRGPAWPLPRPAVRGFPSWSGGRATRPLQMALTAAASSRAHGPDPDGHTRSSGGSGLAAVASPAVTVSRGEPAQICIPR